MTPCEERGYKVGDKFVVTGDGFAGCKIGDTVTLFSDDGSGCPRFKLDGYKGSVFAQLDSVTKLDEKITLRPGDYVSLREVKTDEEYDAVRDAFLAAGCKVTGYNCGMDAEGRDYWDFLGWDVSANILNRWDCGCETAGDRLLTIAQVLGTATVEWDGTGLPPVGSTVELHNDQGYGIQYGHEIIGKNVKVAGFVKSGEVDIAVIEFDAGMYCFRTDMLRPVRTEQQRLTAQLQHDASLKPKAAARVIAAGYRKEVVK